MKRPGTLLLTPPRMPARGGCLVLLACLLLAGCHQNDSPDTGTADAKLPKDEVLLAADSPKRAYIQEMQVSLAPVALTEPVAGKIAYDDSRTTRISSPLTGRVVSDLAPLGKPVKAREALLEIDSPELGQAKEDFANAEADQRLAEESYRRAQMLFQGDVLPRKELQQAEDNVTRARNEVQRTRLHLHNLGADDSRIDNRYVLRSPVAGVITERNANPGMEVRPDLPTPLFVVSDLSVLRVLMDVFEKDLALIHPGKPVTVTVPAYPGEKFSAKVDSIDKVVDETTRTVKVRCLIDNPQGKLLPAMYATVELTADRDNQAISVPLSALFTEGEGEQVFVAIGPGHYKRREVTVGLRMRDKAVIRDGLKPGEVIVSQGALLLRTEEDQDSDAARPAASP